MRNEVHDIVKKRGIKWLLENLISILENQPQEGYIVTLKQNLQTTLDDYNNRYKDETTE